MTALYTKIYRYAFVIIFYEKTRRCSSMVEQSLRKGEVGGSSPLIGSLESVCAGNE